jgi:hypothetical protein
VSIGALNAALIAGNPPERRVERLREFWHLALYGRLPECKCFDVGDGGGGCLRSYIRPTMQGVLPRGLDGLRNRHLISCASSKLKTRYRFESIPGHPVCHHCGQLTCATCRRSTSIRD